MIRAFSRISFAALALALTTATAAVAQQPGQQAPAQSAPQPTASQIAVAQEVIIGSGMARSFEALVPTFGEQIKQLFVTRPELAKDIDAALVQIRPEIEARKQELITNSARMLATRLGEADLQQINTFFASPAGKKYVEVQPLLLNDIFDAMREWANDTADFVLERVRAELQKKGHAL
ncbi:MULTISPECIES: DUF2059 domain-containing protein [unclassified Chelatococcus]|uniref:DUF2059 domain-containing protein n=1 Tax=unclassified Chelatococcus TaxID=2638111 RepID=UPI001BCEB9BC|nr:MULTISPECIES: DUF2059 domain-containing protein [unclassified Chelatococcus]CAH1670222.1 conserved exported hypothetical protein [Hyphomicrobiales bacterium]MBS7739234.1 DUF2059 domain-containing protein [Chelatococcus sp. HY11]MBX3543724.1 DUF2059 domain-containing protein [Chelatococcus sp.]MCO5076233.1 DUF2059 domain-containing protein [Chelatococcus sp.]CAH1677593.1 conserved exported hypothetical protein [Hyphomicrobiales bacterium]